MSASKGVISPINGYACLGKSKPLEKWNYEPRPLGQNDVEIKILHCGICASDIHAIDSGWGGTDYPCIPGHEIVGEVVSKGNNLVNNFQIGELVGVGLQVFSCKKCELCKNNFESYCSEIVLAYNAKYPDGSKSYGGYAKAIRVDSNYVVSIPKGIKPDEAAPLLCAGNTVFAPFRRFGINKGDTVGVVGIGGLGHLALQFAKGFGCNVVAFSSSNDKKEEAIRLGANKFINMSDPKESASVGNSLNYLLITSNAKSNNYNEFASWMKFSGTIILLALPERDIQFNPFSLVLKRVNFTGSFIGGVDDLKAMFDFAVKHNVRPWIERLPMDKVNEGIQKVRDGRVKYRVVLDN